MNQNQAEWHEATAPVPASLAPQPGRRGKLIGLALASLLFMAPLLLLPFARAAQTDAWRPLGLRGETVLALAVTNSEGARIIYAETHTGLWRHTAGTSGAAWERLDAGLPVGPLGGPALAAWQVVPGRPQQIYALIGTGTARQFYRSEDGGRTWVAIGLAPGQTAHPGMLILPGLNSALDQVILVTSSRAQRSSDGGATWAPGGPWPSDATRVTSEGIEPLRQLLADPSVPEHLFGLSRDAVLWASENGGLSWHPLELSQVTAIAITPYFGVRVWAATADKLVLSTDNGASWARMSLPAAPGRVIALRGDPRVPETLYAALESGAVFRSDDGGLTWSTQGRPAATHVTALALDPDLRSQLYAATDDGVWVRTVTPPQPAPIPTPSSIPATPTVTATAMLSPTATATASATPLPTRSATVTAAPTWTTTATASLTPTRGPTATQTPAAIPTLAGALPSATPSDTGGSSGGGQPPTTPGRPTDPPTPDTPTPVPPR